MRRTVLLIAFLLILVVPVVFAKPVYIELREIHRITGGGCCPDSTVDFQMNKTFARVAFDTWILHHHNCGNSLTFKLFRNDTEVYDTDWADCIVSGRVQVSRSLGATVADTFSYKGYTGSHNDRGFVFLDVQMMPFLIRDSLGRTDDNFLDIGEIGSFLNESPASNLFRVNTTTPGVIVWVGFDETEVDQTETNDPTHHILACADTNNNNQCDFIEKPANDCWDAGGDWYNDVCCGVDNVTSCGYVDKFPNGTYQDCTTDWRGRQTCITVQTNITLNAICGNNSQGEWEWIPEDDVGEIHEMTCPDASIVPTGARFYSCGEDFAGTRQFNDFRNFTFANRRHEYSCENKIVEECAGQDIMFSPVNSFTTGMIGTRTDDTYYCASDMDWTTDLDIKDELTCNLANFDWSGSLCCSEADDPAEFYNDESSGALGGCWNEAFYGSGEFSVPERVINFNGSFFGCRITDSGLLAIQDSHTNDFLIDNSIEFCGAVLYDAQPGDRPHATCHPDGIWRFTDEPGGTIEKHIAWSALVNVSGINQTGCCAYEQCWNGTKCQPLDAFYRIQDVGFVCKPPPPEPQVILGPPPGPGGRRLPGIPLPGRPLPGR